MPCVMPTLNTADTSCGAHSIHPWASTSVLLLCRLRGESTLPHIAGPPIESGPVPAARPASQARVHRRTGLTSGGVPLCDVALVRATPPVAGPLTVSGASRAVAVTLAARYGTGVSAGVPPTTPRREHAPPTRR